MRVTVIGAAMLLAAAPAIAHPTAHKPSVAAPAKDKDATAKDASAVKKPAFDLAQMMAVFDKIFPAQPDPPAARLALSRTAVQALFPDGTYANLMGGMTHGVIDRVMGLTDADLGMKSDKAKAGDTMTLKQKLAKDDPYFDERMRIAGRVVSEEFAKLAAIIEPKIREGLARSMARRFDEKQLADINAFLATDSGKAFGSQSMAMWVDPDVMRSVMTSFPEMMQAMPETMKRIEAETAHLPKPKHDAPAKTGAAKPAS